MTSSARDGAQEGAQERAPGGDRPAPRVLLYSKPGCHLCEDARAVVVTVCAETGEDFAEVDITNDPALMQAYGDQIPVTVVDGAQHDFWRVDPTRLRTALVGAPGRR